MELDDALLTELRKNRTVGTDRSEELQELFSTFCYTVPYDTTNKLASIQENSPQLWGLNPNKVCPIPPSS